MQNTWTTSRCTSGGCVRATETAAGEFVFTSTIPGNDGRVVYTATEVAQFLADIKAGLFDGLHRRARDPAGIGQEVSATA